MLILCISSFSGQSQATAKNCSIYICTNHIFTGSGMPFRSNHRQKTSIPAGSSQPLQQRRRHTDDKSLLASKKTDPEMGPLLSSWCQQKKIIQAVPSCWLYLTDEVLFFTPWAPGALHPLQDRENPYRGVPWRNGIRIIKAPQIVINIHIYCNNKAYIK